MNEELTPEQVSEKVSDLRELQMQLQDLLSQAETIMRDIGGIEYDRSAMYWIPQIRNALKDEEDGAMFPMGEILNDIEKLLNGEQSEEDQW